MNARKNLKRSIVPKCYNREAANGYPTRPGENRTHLPLAGYRPMVALQRQWVHGGSYSGNNAAGYKLGAKLVPRIAGTAGLQRLLGQPGPGRAFELVDLPLRPQGPHYGHPHSGDFVIFLQSWAPSFGVLLVGWLGFGFSIIARQPAQAILIHQWFQKREVILVSSLSNILFGLVVGGGLASAPFLLAALGENWRTTFLVFGTLFVFLTVLWAVVGRDLGALARPTQGLPRDAGRRGAPWLTGTCGFRLSGS